MDNMYGIKPLKNNWRQNVDKILDTLFEGKYNIYDLGEIEELDVTVLNYEIDSFYDEEGDPDYDWMHEQLEKVEDIYEELDWGTETINNDDDSIELICYDPVLESLIQFLMEES